MKSTAPIEETRKMGNKSIIRRLLVVLAIIVLYRIGASIPAPGVGQDLGTLAPDAGGALNLFNLFSGGPLTSASLFALGVTPFITAAIAMQLLESVIPGIKEAKRQGKAGADRVNAITRIFGVTLAVIQSVSTAYTLHNRGTLFPEFDFFHVALFSLSVTAGFLLLLWMAELITRHGIGSGVTILLLVSILSSVWDTSRGVIVTEGVKVFFVTLAVILAVSLIVVIASRAERRIPIIRASRFSADTQHLSYLPFKLLHAGVAPIIFATSVLSVLTSALAFTPLNGIVEGLNDPASWIYIVTLGVLVVAFARLYERTSADPLEMANDLMRDSSFIPGVRPGWSTARLVENTSLRLALVACIVLVPVALMHSIGLKWFSIEFLPIAGTSLLIVNTAILDAVRQGTSIRSLYSYEELDKVKA